MGKKGGLRKLLFVVLILLVAIAGGVGWLLLNLGTVAKPVAEKTLSYILDTQVTIRDMGVSLKQGTVELGGLLVTNPPGFTSPNAMDVGRIFIKADTASLTGDQPIVNEVRIENTRISLDKNLTESNLGVLLANARRLEGEKPEEPEAGKPVVIDLLVLENTVVAVKLPVVGQSAPEIRLGRIEMRDIGRQGDPVTIAGAIGEVLEEVLKSVMRSGVDLPKDLMDSLGGALSSAPVEGARDALQGATRGIGDTIRGLGGRRESE